MLLEVPLEAAAARAAAELVEFAADFERVCETRRRGARWRSRAGWFASPVSTFTGLFACLRGCLLAIVFILWIRIAHRDACTTTSPAFGARRAATQEGAVDMDSNASRAGEVERKVGPDNYFSLRGKVHQTPPLVLSPSLAASSLEPKREAVSPPFRRVELQQLRSEFTSELPSVSRCCRPGEPGRPLQTSDGGSSNGRTADSDSASLGSNPSPPANREYQ